MTENERRIITLLSRKGPLTKRELTSQGKMGWSTAVKIVSRLENEGIVHCVGTGYQPEISGNNPLLYDLSDRKPLAIGIDVSYSTIHIILTNLKNTILAQDTYQTPQNPDKSQLRNFLATMFLEFTQKVLSPQEHLEGVGISLPRWLVKHKTNIFPSLAEELTQQLQTRVYVENSSRSYTLYQKWLGNAFSLNNFILLAIRDGFGTGIYYEGNLYRGVHGGAGTLSHLTVVEDGERCRCGKRGCLETVINKDIVYRQYLTRVRHARPDGLPPPSESEIHHGVVTLFSLAGQGHAEALAIVQEAARHIGKGIATLLLILDIPHVIIAADFGPDGAVILPLIEQELEARVTSDIEYSIAYHPLEWPGFAQGAPLLIFKDYFIEIGD